MIAAALVALAGQGARELVRTSALELRAGEVFAEAFLGDVDGDGRPDLVTVSAPADPHARGAPRRRLAVHLARASAPRFGGAADHELALTPDVVAVAVGDVHADPGREIVLWAARGAVAWRPRVAEERARFVRLVEADVLWQQGALDGVLVWRAGVADLDGDGLDDLLTPTPEGFRLHRQRRTEDVAAFEPWALLPIAEGARETFDRDAVRTGDPDDAERGARRFSLSVEAGGRGVEEIAGEPLLTISEHLPAPILADWDGDGSPDCLAQTARELLVWRLGPGAKAKDQRIEPLRLALPVELDLGRRLDVSYAAAAAELDGDGRADCAIFAGDRRANDVRTQVLIYTQAGAPKGEAPLFGDRGKPAQLLVLAGFAGAPRLEDVDGDGRTDLVVASVRPDLIDALTGGEAFEVELDVFLAKGKGFSRQPDLATRVRVDPDAIGRGAAARFLDDAGGDGVRDLLVRERERLALHLVRPRRGGGLELVPKPVWTGPITAEARLSIERPPGAPPAAIVREGARLRVLEVAR